MEKQAVLRVDSSPQGKANVMLEILHDKEHLVRDMNSRETKAIMQNTIASFTLQTLFVAMFVQIKKSFYMKSPYF